ncbi:hypothetical protein [Paenibacillus mucilaginosus]|uniref:hypothetical protein n=1 Tax=Paenibacillus mucilaginosus TaxID=61624 RepID=UPI003D195D89
MESKDLVEVIQDETAAMDRRKNSRYIYDILESMESYGWISCNTDRNRYFTMTSSGLAKMEWFQGTYSVSISKIHHMCRHFIRYIQGDPYEAPPVMTDEEIKLFNRMISVKHTVRYLFLRGLEQYETLSGHEFREMLERFHGWKLNISYLYALIRAIEGPDGGGWVEGRWENPRIRSVCHFHLTPAGKRVMPIEGDNTKKIMQDILRYTDNILRLLGDHTGE